MQLFANKAFSYDEGSNKKRKLVVKYTNIMTTHMRNTKENKTECITQYLRILIELDVVPGFVVDGHNFNNV